MIAARGGQFQFGSAVGDDVEGELGGGLVGATFGIDENEVIGGFGEQRMGGQLGGGGVGGEGERQIRFTGLPRDQTIAQIELWTEAVKGSNKYPVGVYTLPKHLDEKVARLQLKTLNAQLSELTDEQAAYISVPKEGPYKTDHYRY